MRNALRSTGPVSTRGKQRSMQNPRKHGLSQSLQISNDDPTVRAAIELVVADGFDQDAAADIVLALLEHRRVMDTYRNFYLDYAISETISRRPVDEDDELAGSKEIDLLREYMYVSKDPDDRQALKFLTMFARIESRSFSGKVKKL